MKIFLYILTAVLLTCNTQSPDRKPEASTPENTIPLVQENARDSSVISVPIIKNISDTSIINVSGRTIDILFNGIDKYLGGKRNPRMNFTTECMTCEVFQVYREGILFGRRLYVTDDSVQIFQSDLLDRKDKTNAIKMTSRTGKHKFSQGKLSITYKGISCNDAGFFLVNLAYDKGLITVKNLINAFFFEYDLDKDGINEQYLMGTRNCSQELVLLRVNGLN